MIAKHNLVRIEPYLYEIPSHTYPNMRVPARIYADETLLEMALSDRSAEQLANTATLPGVVRYALAMPDIHEGYGFPIGGVAAMRLPEGVISPGGVGYDINCGVRLLSSTLEADAVRSYMPELMTALYQGVPTGVGSSGSLRITDADLRQLLEEGVSWAVRKHYASAEDQENTEERGHMASAKVSAVSRHALERGRGQVGTLGSGNHFLEVDEIAEVYDEETARVFGLRQGTLCVWVHCGSRGLGHQVCTDAVREMQSAVAKYHIQLPDRELACAPFSSPEGQQYFGAMSCAANYAWVNRQLITVAVRRVLEHVLPTSVGDRRLRLLYDVCHNIAKVERQEVDGEMLDLCVHRKGATRAFGPGQRGVPQDYRAVGQPVLVPGSMGTGSYVLVGTQKAMDDTFGSSCHGAGRVWSRSEAKRQVRGEKLRLDLEAENIVVRTSSLAGLAEEAPAAYKNVDAVVDIMHKAGIARKVVRTRPLGVIKG
jgi:tRNA-splicing ligase RtcB (3'-phosphate/5'-hydroxy nucleic acid ligase)